MFKLKTCFDIFFEQNIEFKILQINYKTYTI